MIRRSTLVAAASVAAAITVTWASALVIINPVYREMIKHGFSGITDYQIFETRPLPASPHPSYFHQSDKWQPDSIVVGYREWVNLDHLVDNSATVAFLVIRRDTVLYERYNYGYARDSLVTVFSVSKAVTAMMVGAAIADGYFESVNQPITDFIPELASKGFNRVTINHLLQMTAGLNYWELSINPFIVHTHLYYTRDMEPLLLGLGLKRAPGKRYEYQSGATQLIGLALNRVLAPETITGYFRDRIWNRLGMEYNASWSIDSKEHGLEKTFCGLNITAVDLARLGRLYLNCGQWNGQQIIPAPWVEESTRKDTTAGSWKYYQRGWSPMSDKYGDYRVEGQGGQFLYINPELEVIIVRFGYSRGTLNAEAWEQVFTQIAEKADRRP